MIPRYHETDRGLEIATWLSVSLPSVSYRCYDRYVDASAPGGARGRGILITADTDDAMTIHLKWEGQWWRGMRPEQKQRLISLAAGGFVQGGSPAINHACASVGATPNAVLEALQEDEQFQADFSAARDHGIDPFVSTNVPLRSQTIPIRPLDQ